MYTCLLSYCNLWPLCTVCRKHSRCGYSALQEEVSGLRSIIVQPSPKLTWRACSEHICQYRKLRPAYRYRQERFQQKAFHCFATHRNAPVLRPVHSKIYGCHRSTARALFFALTQMISIASIFSWSRLVQHKFDTERKIKKGVPFAYPHSAERSWAAHTR